jgi:hypothetical protein
VTSDGEAFTAETLMERLTIEARRIGDTRRFGTLTRLIEACDELLSGAAYRRAKGAKVDPEYFNPNFLKLNSNTVHQYVRLRARIEGTGTSWTGPVATTIRAEKDLMAYLKLRAQEARHPDRPRSRRRRSGKLEEIVDNLESITDQAVMRQALADGRQWKRELDIVLATLRRLPEVDIEGLKEGKILSSTTSSGRAASTMAPEETKMIRNLLARLKDNDRLSDFGLVFRNGRLKMEFAPGTDLMLPEEVVLLERLAGSSLEVDDPLSVPSNDWC